MDNKIGYTQQFMTSLRYPDHKSNANYIKYIHINEDIMNDAGDLELNSKTGEDILLGLFGDSFVYRLKNLPSMFSDERITESDYLRGTIIPIVNVTNINRLAVVILAIGDMMKGYISYLYGFRNLFDLSLLESINEYKEDIDDTTSYLEDLIVFATTYSVRLFELVNDTVYYSDTKSMYRGNDDFISSDTYFYKDLDIINSIIQSIPIYVQKSKLGDTIQSKHHEAIKRFNGILGSMMEFKCNNSEDYYPDRAPEMRVKIFELFDLIIPTGYLEYGEYPVESLNESIGDHLTIKSKLPNVLIDIVDSYTDPFDIVLYEQGDSKSRFDLARKYFLNNNINPDTIISKSNGIVGKYKPLFVDNCEIFDNHSLSRCYHCSLMDPFEIYSQCVNEVYMKLYKSFDDSDPRKLEIVENTIQTLLERTVYFIFLLDYDTKISDDQKHKILRKFVTNSYDGYRLSTIYSRDGIKLPMSQLEVNRTNILFDMFSKRGIKMESLHGHGHGFEYNCIVLDIKWDSPIYTTRIWKHLTSIIGYRMTKDNDMNDNMDDIEQVANMIGSIIAYEMFTVHNHYDKDHIQMLKDIRSMLDEFI